MSDWARSVAFAPMRGLTTRWQVRRFVRRGHTWPTWSARPASLLEDGANLRRCIAQLLQCLKCGA